MSGIRQRLDAGKPREVDEVVRLVIEHAETRPEESLGVIAMGIKHANRVQAALDRALEGTLAGRRERHAEWARGLLPLLPA